MKLQTLQDFILLLSEELTIAPEVILPESKFRELENWSSLNALVILSRIHEESGILISPVQLAKVNTVQALFQYLQ